MFENIKTTFNNSLHPDMHKNHISLLNQKMQENLNHALRIAKVGSWVMELDSGDVYWSEETYRICGIPDDIKLNVNMFLEIIHPEDLNFVKKNINQTIYNGEPYEFDHRIILPNGTERLVHERGELVYDEKGNPIFFVGTIQDITEQAEAKRQLEQSEQRYKSLFKYNLHGTFILDDKGCIQDLNLAAEEMFGYSKAEHIGMTFTNIVDEEDHKLSLELFRKVLSGEPQTFELNSITKYKKKRKLLGTAVPIVVNHKIEGIIGAIRDITEQQIVEEKLENSQAQLLTLIQSIPDFVILKDGNGKWVLANQFALSLFQLENFDYVGKTDIELASYMESYREGLSVCVETDEQVWKTGKIVRLEEIITKPDGSSFIFDVLKTPIFHPDGSRKGLVVVGRDITERKKMEEQNQFLAYHDSLTNLPNRRGFDKQLEEFLVYSRALEKKLAILYMDLDRFKYINDTLGHDIGDKLLISVAEKMRSCIPDQGFFARMGGDEFAVILPINTVDFSIQVAKDIISSIKEPFHIDGYEMYITTSVGISIFPDDGTDNTTIMKNADIALYRAKDKGKNGIQVYNSQMNIGAFKAFHLEKDLYKAIQNNEFELYYQPRVDAHTGKIVAAEALIRWNHPDWGLVSPGEFIPLAMETNLIVEIGKWVKETVCKQIKNWHQEGLPIVPISINISPKRFTQIDFIDHIEGLLEKYNLEGKWLEIELTENSLIENEEKAIYTIRKLQELGLSISLDDFGTGYSSISYLKKFAVNSIKIDQSYIRDIHSDSVNANIVRGIIKLAKSIGVSIVAEGVETKEQLLFLKRQHCNQIQGYLFSKPVPKKEFRQLLRKRILVPQSKSEKQNFQIENQRRYFRTEFYFPLSADMTIIKIKGKSINLGKTEVLIEDIGLGGLRFLSTVKLAVHKEIILEFETEILGELSNFYGAVVWCREMEDDIYQYGLEFSIHENERSLLARSLNQLSLQLRKSPLVPNCRFITIDKINYFKSKLES